ANLAESRLRRFPQTSLAADAAASANLAESRLRRFPQTSLAADAAASANLAESRLRRFPQTSLAADAAALRATVFGTPPQSIPPLPATVPPEEIDITMPWARPVPKVFWFNRRLRVWFSAQDKPAPLAIVISGTGSDGNVAKMSLLRGALYGAGYHVL